MRVHKTVGLWAIIALITACVDSPTEPAPVEHDAMFAVAGVDPVVGSVTGSGHVPCALESVNRCLSPGPLRTFSVNARVLADGSVSGVAQWKNRANEVSGMVDIECLNFFGEGQTRAWMVGTITRSSLLPVGLRVGFGVADNGEGERADVDQITGVGPGPQFFIDWVCEPDATADAQLDLFFDNVFGFDIANGNVQVRAP